MCWYTTDWFDPKANTEPAIPKANVEKLGAVGQSAMDAVREAHEKKRGKPLMWVLTGDVYRLTDAKK